MADKYVHPRSCNDDDNHELFDYIMNDRTMYRELGRVVGAIIRRAKRFRRTVEQEVEAGATSPYDVTRWWHHLTQIPIRAREDYFRCFPWEDPPPWACGRGRYDELVFLDYRALARLAYQHRDRWDPKTLEAKWNQ